jgi:alpha-beta hydrolase superfamily lysophospholipase
MNRVALRRPGRRAALVAGSVALLLLALVAGVGWYYSSLLRDGALLPDDGPDELDFRIVRIEDRQVTLAPDGGDEDNLRAAGIWGLEGEDGYGQVLDVLSVEGDEVTRAFEAVRGTLGAGDHVRLDSFAFDGDPLTARGIAYRDVAVPSPLGDLPAWKIDGSQDAWVIFVHGWRSEREEALRILPAVTSLGWSALVITYRNDEEAPRSPDGLIRWGATEWQDLEAAVDYATAQGARSIVLYGYSMGGGIAVSFLQRSDRNEAVVGAVLDAPVLDFAEVVAFQADRRGIPGFLVPIGKQFTSWRFDFDWDETDHLSRVDRLDVPVVLFHGTEDDQTPIEVSARFAEERADIVTYVVTEGAGHVRSWNVDPAGYEAAVREFLLRVAEAP